MVVLNLDDLRVPSPRKWLYPLFLIREEGHELVCQSTLPRDETRQFLMKNRLFSLFDDILYTNHQPPTITDLRHLPPLCKRQWTRTRLTFALDYGGA